MNINIKIKKEITDNWFSFLQGQICKEFENLEKGIKFKKRKEDQEPSIKVRTCLGF